MSGMTKHARDRSAPRDHLWVLAIIAACALLELVTSWVTIGSMSGFPVIGGKDGLPTAWTLAVTTEAYWGYALYAWLAAAPGRRSRRFAMWSTGVVFLLSLTGQGAAPFVKPGKTPPAALVVFLHALPVIVLALIAVLVHLRQLDREEAEEAARRMAEAERQAAAERAEADERAALRRELAAATEARDADVSALRAELDAERSARETAQRDAAEALARAEKATAKLAAQSGHGPDKRQKGAQPRSGGGDPLEKETNKLRAIMELRADPSLCGARMGGELARRLSLGASTGRRLHGELTENGRLKPEYERSAEGSAASGERSR